MSWNFLRQWIEILKLYIFILNTHYKRFVIKIKLDCISELVTMSYANLIIYKKIKKLIKFYNVMFKNKKNIKIENLMMLDIILNPET